MRALSEAEDHRLTTPSTESGKYERRARMAEKAGLIPKGMQITIEYERVDQERIAVVALVPLPAWRTRTLDPVPVAKHLRNPTDVVEQFQDSEDFPVEGTPRNRALRLIDALVWAARDNGMTVKTHKHSNHQDRYGRPFDKPKDALQLWLQRDRFQLRFTQATLQVPHEPTERELTRARRGYLFPDFDEVPSEQLRIVLDGDGGTFWASSWADTDEIMLEEHLAQILEEIRLRHGALEEARAEEEEHYRRRRQEEEERTRLEAVERGKALLRYRQYAIDEAARDQARLWKEAHELRAYAEAVRQHALDTKTEERRIQSAAWVDHILTVADRLDPFPDSALPPESIPSPSKEKLAPFFED